MTRPESASTAARRLLGPAAICTAVSCSASHCPIARSAADGSIATVAILAVPKLLTEPITA